MKPNVRGMSSRPPPRGPTVSRAASAACEALDRAVKATAYANEAVGDACGLTEKVIRKARDAEAPEPLSMTRLLMLPPKVFAAYLAELADAHRRLHGGGLTLTPERAANNYVGRSLHALSEVHEALADGRVTPDEFPRVLAALAGVEECGASLRRVLRLDDDETEGGIH